MAKPTGKKPPAKAVIAGFKPTATKPSAAVPETTAPDSPEQVEIVSEKVATPTSAPEATASETPEKPKAANAKAKAKTTPAKASKPAKPSQPTCTVCLIVRNEKPYLIEWIAYYRQLGFDRILIYDNMSSDGSDVLLKALADAGKIDYRLWRLGRMESPQLTAFNDAALGLDTEWVFFADVDEFLVLHDAATVGEFLAGFADKPDVGMIGVNWRVFGDSYQDKFSSAPVIERFTWASESDFGANRHFKTFTRVAGLRRVVNRHICEAEGRLVHASGQPMVRKGYGYSEITDLTVAQLNHYYGKTWGEYGKKMARGQAGVGEVDAILKYGYSELTFRRHNANDVIDRSALKAMDKVVGEMNDLRTILQQGALQKA